MGSPGKGFAVLACPAACAKLIARSMQGLHSRDLPCMQVQRNKPLRGGTLCTRVTEACSRGGTMPFCRQSR